LLSADADSVCGAAYGARDADRTNRRNGYRHRDLDTRIGTLDVAVPKLREGSYFPEWLLERRRRAEAALTSVVATCYLLGVSTRRMDRLVQSLGITGLSKSQVSVMAGDLDELVRDFRERPLDEGPYTFVAADALTMKVREGGRVVKIAAMIATGVNADGYREILGVATSTSESGAGWNTFFKDLVARGLSGVALVTSDAHAGLVEAIGANLPGATWQRPSPAFRRPRTGSGAALAHAARTCHAQAIRGTRPVVLDLRVMGPVQVLVVGFDQPRFSGEVLAELTRLREAGIVRLIDMLLVSRAEDGTLETLAPPDGTGADLGGLAAAVRGRPEAEGTPHPWLTLTPTTSRRGRWPMRYPLARPRLSHSSSTSGQDL
jgi:Transposase, Mutator family/Family of unknown function (DUF6325)